MAPLLLVVGHVVGHCVELGIGLHQCHVLRWFVMETMDLDESGQRVVLVVDELVFQREN